MNAAQATTDREQDLAQRDPERGRMLGLVRKLIDYGRDLVASLQSRDDDTPPLGIARRFGGVTLALIITRITRGLMIAAALEKRLLHPRPRPRSCDVARAEPRGSRGPRRPKVDEEAELLAGLPSAREIAARIRGQRAGAVIADICRDMAIGTDHPLWPEINMALIQYGGNLGKLLRISLRRAEKAWHLPIPLEDQIAFDRLLAAYAQPP